jgi:maleylpyruvate isomerase
MTTTAELNHTRSWMDTGTALFTATVSRLTDADLAAATVLPAWSRRHVIAHVALNAQALRRLVRWARTGEPTLMYASPEQRTSDIEEAMSWPSSRLRSLLADTALQLATDLDRLPPGRWTAQVRTAQGRTITAREIPWLRTREVAVHVTDLNAGVTFEDLPDELCAALVTDVARLRSSRGHDPAVALRSGDQAWLVTGTGEPAQVEGSPAALARWLTGRGTSGLTVTGGTLPPLSPWL